MSAILERHLAKGKLPTTLKSVLYLDRQVLVMNKPAGLVSQLGRQLPEMKTRDTLDKVLKQIERRLELKEALRPLHRLDTATTGCLAFATTQTSARSLSKQFAQGEVEKSYLALVSGGKETFPGTSGRIDTPIKYQDGYFDGLGTGGKPSLTEWSLLASSPVLPISLVRLNLLTGNKHQLRIHMAKKLGAPILGDDRYSSSKVASKLLSEGRIKPNLYLHASDIAFVRYRQRGPQKRFRLGINAPLPAHFVEACKAFRIELPKECEGGLSINGEPIPETTIPELDGHYLRQEPSPTTLD
ncbi:tRNA-pseudouridine synthase [Coprinopsis cinerea AmutBmut pab1-1]|nr:tRNA-pseudouridine synthase [Coprinopsis cinerea AmutBmut pab1-1]